MTHDPEAAWPLTDTDQGYYPGPASPQAPLPPSRVVPYTGPQGRISSISTPMPGPKPMSHGVRIAYLAIILGVSIPLTAISVSMIGVVGLIITWVGLVFIAALAFGSSIVRGRN